VLISLGMSESCFAGKKIALLELGRLIPCIFVLAGPVWSYCIEGTRLAYDREQCQHVRNHSVRLEVAW
jgi:hypothetical protein